jgi:tetratricopeptide (TPR) repeat protein
MMRSTNMTSTSVAGLVSVLMLSQLAIAFSNQSTQRQIFNATELQSVQSCRPNEIQILLPAVINEQEFLEREPNYPSTKSQVSQGYIIPSATYRADNSPDDSSNRDNDMFLINPTFTGHIVVRVTGYGRNNGALTLFDGLTGDVLKTWNMDADPLEWDLGLFPQKPYAVLIQPLNSVLTSYTLQVNFATVSVTPPSPLPPCPTRTPQISPVTNCVTVGATATVYAGSQPNADDYIRLGDAYQKSGCSQLAIASYSQALLIDPQNGTAYLQRGVAYKDIGNLQSAIDDFTIGLNQSATVGLLKFTLLEQRSDAYIRQSKCLLAKSDLQTAYNMTFEIQLLESRRDGVKARLDSLPC